MPNHHTALNKNKRKAEESGGEAFGPTPFSSFLQKFNPIFQARTRPNFYKNASRYLSGLFLRDRRRNLEKIQQSVVDADYQSLHHFLTESPWDQTALKHEIAKDINQLIGGGSNTALLIDPSSFAKKGKHSVGVARQYSGRLGKVDNCQIGVFAALANGGNATLINHRLYLPKTWCEDPERCQKAGIPEEEQGYKSTAQLALELIDEADEQQLDYQWVGMDAEFSQPWLLSELHKRDKQFLIDVRANTYLYRAHPKLSYGSKSGGSTQLRIQRKPVKASQFLPKRSGQGWKKLCFKQGRKGKLIAQFRRKYVWVWDRKSSSQPLRCHLIIRRTFDGETGGWRYKYSLSNAPERTPLKRLAYQQSQRFWVEQAIRDAKDSLGMAEYQCRKWRAWHHHMALTFLAALYVLKKRLEHRETMPLLSIGDVKELLAFMFPKRVAVISELWTQIRTRHRQLEAQYQRTKRFSEPLLI